MTLNHLICSRVPDTRLSGIYAQLAMKAAKEKENEKEKEEKRETEKEKENEKETEKEKARVNEQEEEISSSESDFSEFRPSLKCLKKCNDDMNMWLQTL